MQNDYPSRNNTKGYGLNSNMRSQITSRAYPDPDSSEENILPIQSKAVLKSTTYTVAYEVDPKTPAWVWRYIFYEDLECLRFDLIVAETKTPCCCTLFSNFLEVFLRLGAGNRGIETRTSGISWTSAWKGMRWWRTARRDVGTQGYDSLRGFTGGVLVFLHRSWQMNKHHLQFTRFKLAARTLPARCWRATVAFREPL